MLSGNETGDVETVDAGPPLASVSVVQPATALQSYVTFYYIVRVTGPLTDFLYPEWGNVRFALSGDWQVRTPGEPWGESHLSTLFGPTDRHGEILTGGGTSIGFGLTPAGWHRLIGDDASTMANRARPLHDELGIGSDELRSSLIADENDKARLERLEDLLLSLLERRPPPDPMIVAIDNVLRERPGDVEAFAAAAGVSPRTLHRLCLRGFGFAPKRLLRRQRFLETLGQVRSAVGASVGQALGADYFDQAHFYRDFRDFMAMTPRAYFGAPRPLMSEAAAAQVRAGVTLSFALPPPLGGVG